MVVIVTRDVADRFRGFLASCMLEIAPGVYTAPRMSNELMGWMPRGSPLRLDPDF